MGQSNSRYQPRHPADSSAEDGIGQPSTSRTTPSRTQLNAEDDSNNPANHLDVGASASPRQSRRSLVRRSFLGLAKSSSQSSSPEGSLASNASTKLSWLNPRRWSRTPSSLVETADERSSTLVDGPSNGLLPPNAKGKEREEYDDASTHDLQPQSATDEQPTDTFLSPLIVPSPSTSQDRPESGHHETSFASVSESRPASQTAQRNEVLSQPTPGMAETLVAVKQDPAPPQEPPTLDESVQTIENDSSTTTTVGAFPAPTSASNELPGDNTSAIAATPAPATAPSRPFPPPGTLVVVQGVVHTTDVPRSGIGLNSDLASVENRTQPSRSASQDGNATSARSRLSTLLRPRSIGPTFGVSDSSPPEDSAAQTVPNNHSVDSAESNVEESTTVTENSAYTSPELNVLSRPSSAYNDASSAALADESPLHTLTEADDSERRESVSSGGQESANQHSDDGNGSGPISSSSIDVLGTLLSVAAAATAASLLTGSSEPILPSSHSTNALPNSVHGHGVGAASNMPSPDFSAAGRAERMRNAWTSIRERLGIRSSGSSGNPSSNTTGAGAAAQSAAEAREMMLGEMARAFSVGLGLGSFAGPTAPNNNLLNRSAEAPVTPETRAPPTEGSFERFLMDLQADLRIALTTGEGGNGVRAMAAGSGWSDARPDPSSYENQDQTREEDTAPLHNPEDHNSANVQDQPNDQDNAPALQEVGDEGESVSPEVAADPDDSQDETQGLTGPGRINWWRLYRFPAIGVPRSNTAASAAAAAALSTNNSDNSSATPALSSGSSMEAPSIEATTHAQTMSSSMSVTPAPSTRMAEDSTGSAREAATPNTVVPVIIVGLQSVNMDWRQGDLVGFNANEHQHQHQDDTADDLVDDGMDDIFGPAPDPEANTDRENDGTQRSADAGATDTSANQRRGRRWRSRAADALRSLRPRRGGEQRNGIANGDAGAPQLAQQMPTMGPGSRMFLIYVIGGYYPPNHSIVLGNPADMESFEALSELAELLGQVKPPTATKEEIEKSGLQVFKASRVGEYEREGKISGNCVERCLICLDDYDVEDDVRLMACRHAFHRDCVDKWLQTGKNNCPACRSRGVSTENRGPFVS
ncbi:hypothetical protein APHAL10511_002334 [Amanita phalloides]|nr:hypothetical protein APHAL10511_002334 [Amanita phalloides]